MAITQATPTVSITGTGGTYTGAAWPATGTVTGVGSPAEALGAPSFTYYSGTTAAGTPLAGAPTTAGTYTVRGSFGGNTNYTSAYADKTITITQATPTVSITWTGGTYTGAAWPATGGVTGGGGPGQSLGAPSFTYYSGTTATGTPLAGGAASPAAN